MIFFLPLRTKYQNNGHKTIFRQGEAGIAEALRRHADKEGLRLVEG